MPTGAGLGSDWAQEWGAVKDAMRAQAWELVMGSQTAVGSEPSERQRVSVWGTGLAPQ